MGTILFNSVVFGPVKSRRLGISLGINLLPNNSKLCNYNCVYCECGWTFHSHLDKGKFHTSESVLNSLEAKLKSLLLQKQTPDSITFAGNGEPTLHPSFADIMDGVISLRNHYFPDAKVAVLSNGTMAHMDEVFAALSKADRNMLKLDTAIEETYQKLNRPPKGFTVKKIISNLSRFKENLIIQSLFISGRVDGVVINNTTPEELRAWITALKKLSPVEVQVYSTARETPVRGLKKLSAERLSEIASFAGKHGLKATVFD
jgi:wyosine [tRNA(Phe)-imidazoG37] synthetase (radical SAM superfamily)